MDSNDFHVTNLENYNNPLFNETLENAPLNLTKKKSRAFFRIVFNHFSNDKLPIDIGKKILQTLIKVFANDARLKDFIDGEYYLKLPYKETNFQDQIFDILYFVFISFPSVISLDMVENIRILISLNAEKSLILLTIYAQHFNSINNPWPIVDLLISEGKYFLTEKIAANYISLLSFLNKCYEEYRNSRSLHSWNQIYQMLSIFKSNDIIKACYMGLCAIADEIQNCYQIPLNYINTHIQNNELQNVVLSFLDIAKISEKESCNKKLLKNLLNIAQNNVKATLVLMHFSENKAAAKEIVSLSNLWMEKPLPTVQDTLRLFLIIMKHNDIREVISKTKEFANFMKMTLILDVDMIIPLDCTILRRIALNSDLITALSSNDFLSYFFNKSHESKNFNTKHSSFLLTDTLTRFCYIKEMLIMCDWCAEEILQKGNFSDQATLVAIRLFQFPECKKRMKENKLNDYFKNKQNEGSMKTFESQYLHKSKK